MKGNFCIFVEMINHIYNDNIFLLRFLVDTSLFELNQWSGWRKPAHGGSVLLKGSTAGQGEVTDMEKDVLGAVFGLCVADALGVPVEFKSREYLMANPVTGMLGYGTYDQPPGTWSDDTSMTLCLLDSLSAGLDYTDIMNKFVLWFHKHQYTPHGYTFDIGGTTQRALERFMAGVAPLECGGLVVRDNGNGALMRILPLTFFLYDKYGADVFREKRAMEIIHNIASLTHGHPRNHIACGIYIAIALQLLDGENLLAAAKAGISSARDFYRQAPEYGRELHHFERLFAGEDFARLDDGEIKSSGYVVDTLEAALWCLLNTKNYRECVLKAVNLGDDTDTVGAVAGGLGGLYYGLEAIPEEWRRQIPRKEFIAGLCRKFAASLVSGGTDRQ